MKSFWGRKEILNICYIYEEIKDESIRMRIKNCLEWYIKSACFYRFVHYLFSLVSIILPIFVAVLNSLSDQSSWVVTLLSGIVSMCASILTLTKAQERWFLYRTTCENMKREVSLFYGKASPYSEESQEKDLLKALEALMKVENTQWQKQKEK